MIFSLKIFLYLSRLSSCNNKFKPKIFHDDYSNETTSENSNNFSIRRNYCRLKRLKDSSINQKNDNITTFAGHINNTKDEKNHIIKCNIKYKENRSIDKDKNYNESKYSKFKDCLKIGTINRRFRKRLGDINSIDKDINQPGNITKRAEIRSYYKIKNINNFENDNKNL